ncbi:hypothetical protein [uncultured Oscillibacter sp.]|uniref:hypothetical protein n=1 Tax=uncultured Oscillibacter sp. TaxID=876091 RepID=UPI002636F285|nr:hypothetical protein [uncultured Oscillibacter sp.]
MKNLSAEMRRYGVTNADIQNAIGCSLKTVVNKLNESTEFSVSEALSIRDKFFPSLRIAYLFASDGERTETNRISPNARDQEREEKEPA